MGVAFRDAHGIVGKIVLYCIDKKCGIDDLTLDELKQFSPAFDQDVYDAISLKTCVDKRLTTGAPGKPAMENEIMSCVEYLKNSDSLIERA